LSFFDNIESAARRDEEVELFDILGSGYYAYLETGERLDIQRAFNFQPRIDNFGDYYSAMFAETPSAFFVFRQRVVEGKAEPWRTFLEIKARRPSVFYAQACSLACRLREMSAKPRDGSPPG
jgi:hypothetical protein